MRDAVTEWMRRQGASEQCIAETILNCESLYGGGDVELPGSDDEIIAGMNAEFNARPPEFWDAMGKHLPHRN